MLLRSTPFRTVALAIVLAVNFTVAAANAQSGGGESMRAYLRSRIQARPDDARAWRMLGSYLLQHDGPAASRDALERAVALDDTNAAAQFDLGRCLLQLGQQQPAAGHLRQAAALAPGSDYARQAGELLRQLPAAPQIVPVSYDVKRLDGSGRTRELVDSAYEPKQPSPLFFKIDVGALFNSNVTLTPISRDFGLPQRESAQGIFNPVVEYRLVNNDFWKAGPTFSGYFTVNENDALSSLNLQSYQPGAFAERTVCRPTAILVQKLQYDYTLDEFDNVRFGNRHGFTGSVTSLWDSGSTSVAYLSTNYTDFADDGVNPATSSRDGWTHGGGASHAWPLGWRLLSSFTVGGDLEWADVQGSDFAYFGGAVFAAFEVPVTDTMWFDLEAGVGLRDYHQSAINPSRNEAIWRASAKLTKQFTPRWSLSGVFNFDRFASDNALFEAERFIGGIVASYQR